MARATGSGTRADAAVLAACVVVSFVTTILPSSLREPFAGAVRETFIGPLIGLQDQFTRARGAFVERDRIAAHLDSLVLRNAELQDMGRENDHLRALLGLGARLGTNFVPAEAVQRPELGDPTTVVVTAGSDVGVVERSAVVAPEGLVGIVIGVSSATSNAILWTHPDFRVSAVTADGTAFGIVAPHLGEGSERFLLELRGVAFRDSLAPGTRVVSSGLGSVFPRGIPIGTVLGQLETGEGWSRTYLVRPAVLPADASAVMVLLPLAGGTDVSGAWRAGVNADSARQAIGRVADSLAPPVRDASGARPPR